MKLHGPGAVSLVFEAQKLKWVLRAPNDNAPSVPLDTAGLTTRLIAAQILASKGLVASG